MAAHFLSVLDDSHVGFHCSLNARSRESCLIKRKKPVFINAIILFSVITSSQKGFETFFFLLQNVSSGKDIEKQTRLRHP